MGVGGKPAGKENKHTNESAATRGKMQIFSPVSRLRTNLELTNLWPNSQPKCDKLATILQPPYQTRGLPRGCLGETTHPPAGGDSGEHSGSRGTPVPRR
jgi:hypothetical protein